MDIFETLTMKPLLLQCILFLVFCVMTDLQELEEYTSLAIQIKVLLSFVALFYLRYKEPTLHRPIKVRITLKEEVVNHVIFYMCKEIIVFKLLTLIT